MRNRIDARHGTTKESFASEFSDLVSMAIGMLERISKNLKPGSTLRSAGTF